MWTGDNIVVYILQFTDGTYYTGITNNLERRWDEHCSKKGGYTSHLDLSCLVWVSRSMSRVDARMIEVYIKSVSVSKFIFMPQFKELSNSSVVVEKFVCSL